MLRRSLLALAALLLPIALQATTIVLPTDEQLIAKSPVIVAGEVLSSQAVVIDGAVFTESIVAVARTLRGAASPRIVVRDLGGETAERGTRIFGRAEYAAGERVLLFLEPSPRGGYRTMDLFVGKFTERQRRGGVRVWTRDDAGQDAALLDADLDPIEGKNVARHAERFEAFIEARVAGRPGDREYRTSLEPADRAVRSEFELLVEPTVYRWSRFDTNGSAAWVHHGEQPGYGDGGVSELRTAIAQWTSYGEARILYAHTGAASGAPGGLTRANGVNEVLFDDPLNEIPGTWDGMSGVLGMGGLSNYRTGPSWTAPFAADAAHPAGSMPTREITEANLTIQDGVAPGGGIPSSEFAEILSHELGHTLGFGHSADPSALMYFELVGLGPQLRADDRLAARWLYPRGTTTDPDKPAVPLAPSNLRAIVSGSSVDLSWTDRAANESGFSIYLAQGGGSFVKLGNVAANTISARVGPLSQGSYQAYVVAFNEAGTSDRSNVVSFSLVEAPVAAFTFDPPAGSAGKTLFTFTDRSTGPVTSRFWTFGDGTTSSLANPTHVYTQPGQYTVTLLVNGNGLVSQVSKPLLVSGPLAASFVYAPSAPTTSTTVQFTDLSSGGPASWTWSFGDGTTSQAQNPTKLFKNEGTYDVTLTVERAGETAATTLRITVDNDVPVTPAVVAAFDASTTTPTVGERVAFTDRSTGAPTQWLWEFGDGTTSTERNPAHEWTVGGTYTVRLTASNGGSASIAMRDVVVGANAPHRTLVSVAAQTGGVGGTSWRTELSLFNAGDDAATVTMLFLPAAGGTFVTRALFLPARESVTFENALLDLFGIESGAGAIAVETAAVSAAPDIRITSRTFTGSARGTYGQSVPDVASDALSSALHLTGLKSSDAFRTNVGIVNRASRSVIAAITLFTFSGGEIATRTLTLDATSFQQQALTSLFPEIAGQAHDVLSMRIVTEVAGAVSVYGSVVDNATQDPVYLQAVGAPSGSELLVPVVGRAEGANGTFWRSDVALFNPTSSRMTLAMTYRGESKPVVLDAHDTKLVADVVGHFGATAGSGTLRVSWSTPSGPVVASRTYTSVASGGTFGQAIAPVGAFARELYVPGLRHDTRYRTNAGIVNGGSAAADVELAIYAADGRELGTAVRRVEGGAQLQVSLSSLFPGLALDGSVTLHVRGSEDARLFAWGSMVDNESGDPVFFAGR